MNGHVGRVKPQQLRYRKTEVRPALIRRATVDPSDPCRFEIHILSASLKIWLSTMSVFASVLAIMVTNMHSNLCVKICLYYSMWFKYESSLLELEMGADVENIWIFFPT